MQKEEEILDIPASEKDDDYSDDSLYSINSWGADLSFRELIAQYEDGDLAKPELQRNYVWDKGEASRFIDSILLGLPVPSIFLAKTKDEKMLIIDGYQRIMTVYDFVRGIFSTDGKVFRLINSEKINARWRGKAFSELSETEQRKIRTTTIHCIIFIQVSPKDNDTSLYQIFERINTSGRTLLPQEIRNCVYQGSLNDLLFELNRDTSWRRLYGLAIADSRMRDMEFILRFLAFGSKMFRDVKAQRLSLKKFLNEYMGNPESTSPDGIASSKDRFLSAIRFLDKNLGSQAFHNISSSDSDKVVSKFNPTVFDSIMLATQYVLKTNPNPEIESKILKQRKLDLLKDEKFQDLIRVRTTDVDRINERIAFAAKHLYGVDYE
ncbi:MAG: DUF262 domain-containing protein [Anaerolineae bacterium]